MSFWDFVYTLIFFIIACATLGDVYEDWNELIDESEWIYFDNSLPDCKHGIFLPIRIKTPMLKFSLASDWN